MMKRVLLLAVAGVTVAACSCSDDPSSGIGPGRKKDAAVDSGDLDADDNVDACPPTGCTPGGTVTLDSDWLPGDDDTLFGGVTEEPGGPGEDPWLTLGDDQNVDTLAESVWVSNTGEGTVSRLSVTTGKEIARYVSSVKDTGSRPWGFADARPWDEACVAPFFSEVDGTGNCPSRTAVDQRYDAYVANRAFDGRSSVTKFANKVGDCIDRNTDGDIQTSEDKDANGSIDMNQSLPDADREFWGEDDECILWTRPTGAASGEVARALAVGKASGQAGTVGDLWVGLNFAQKLVRMDANTGDVEETLDVAPVAPYGAAAGPDGRVWFVFSPEASDDVDTPEDETRQVLGYVERDDNGDYVTGRAPALPDTITTTCLVSYGVALDAKGRVWIANVGCSPGILYFDPSTSTWAAIDPPPVRRYGALGSEIGNQCLPMEAGAYALCADGVTDMSDTTAIPVAARGVGVSFDSVWFAISFRCTIATFGSCFGNLENLVGRIDISGATPVFSKYLAMPASSAPVGVGYSSNGKLWAVGQGSNQVSYVSLDNNDEVVGAWSSQPVGSTPYTYSDFIGFGLNVLATPDGYFRQVIEGCPVDQITRWKSITFDAEEPTNTNIKFSARAASSKTDLEDTAWIENFDGASPISLEDAPGPVPNGRFFELEILLQTTDPAVRPKVRNVSVSFTCEPATPN
jgi:hypothetical protein